jgi:large-conductance mechanosensitive channel
MDNNNNNNSLNFTSFIISYVSLSVIAGLFTYRLLNSFLDNIILPILDISILPETKFHKLTKTFNHKKQEINNNIENEKYIYVIRPGAFLKELVIWCFMMLLLYFIYSINNKNK